MGSDNLQYVVECFEDSAHKCKIVLYTSTDEEQEQSLGRGRVNGSSAGGERLRYDATLVTKYCLSNSRGKPLKLEREQWRILRRYYACDCSLLQNRIYIRVNSFQKHAIHKLFSKKEPRSQRGFAFRVLKLMQLGAALWIRLLGSKEKIARVYRNITNKMIRNLKINLHMMTNLTQNVNYFLDTLTKDSTYTA